MGSNPILVKEYSITPPISPIIFCLAFFIGLSCGIWHGAVHGQYANAPVWGCHRFMSLGSTTVSASLAQLTSEGGGE
jgi:hypothetical protein